MKEGYLQALLFLLLVSMVEASKYCGYVGEEAETIDQNFSDCLSKQKQDTRLQTAIAFEVCFGYNFTSLNTTVYEPYRKKRLDVNKKLVDFALTTCDLSLRPDKRPMMKDGVTVDAPKEALLTTNCRQFFDLMVDELFRDEFTEESIKNLASDNKDLISHLYNFMNRGSFYNEIVAIMLPLKQCQEPELKLRNTLVQKYLQEFIDKIINPKNPSFNWQNIDVLLNADVYALKSDRYDTPIFEKEIKEESDIQSKRLKLTTLTKPILMERREFEDKSQKEKNKERKYFRERDKLTTEELLKEDREKEERIKKDDMDDEDYYGMTLKELNEHKEIPDETYNLRNEFDEDHKHDYEKQIEISDIWDPNLIIGRQRFNDEDYNRYKIRGFDIDGKINTLFAI